MKKIKILSHGGGLQTTALVVLRLQKRVYFDHVIFSDTGGEKPETYWYIDNHIKPLLLKVGVPFEIVKSEVKSCQPDLCSWLWKHGQIPPIGVEDYVQLNLRWKRLRNT